MSGRARGSKRKADEATSSAAAAAAAAAAAGTKKAGRAVPAAAAAAGSKASSSLYAIYIRRQTKVVEYDEESYDNFDFTYKVGNNEEGLMSELDAAASSLHGCRYYNNSKEGPQLAVRDIKVRKEKSQKKGTTAGPSNSRGGGDGDGDGDDDGDDDDGMLVVFDSVEAANAKAAEVMQQEAKTVPEECELLLDEPLAEAGGGGAAAAAAAGASAAASTAGKKGSKGRAGAAGSTGEKGGRGKSGPESSAAAAGAAGDVGAMADVGGGRGSCQVEQVMKVAMWDELNCIAVSTITVEVVLVQLKRGG